MPDFGQILPGTMLPETELDDQPLQIGETDTALQSQRFEPFEKEIQCPNCEHHMLMWLQPLHNNMDLSCPACLHPLGFVLRREIREHLAQL